MDSEITFKKGQTVLVEGAFASGGEGMGTIVSKKDDEFYKVYVGGMVIDVRKGRLKDAETEIKKRRDKFMAENEKYKVKF